MTPKRDEHSTHLNTNEYICVDELFFQRCFDEVRVHDTDDPISKCDGVDQHNLVERTDELFELANKKLHVFPFKDVEKCWFRLYTDTSIIKALQALRLLFNHESQDAENLDKSLDKILDQIVSILDMALIMAGGIGRENLIRSIFDRLARSQQHRSKPEQFSQEEHSVPKISYPIQQITQPSLMVFQKHMYQSKQPILLLSILDQWPALALWNDINYWLNITLEGRRLVPIEVGRSYIDDEWGQSIVPFKEFLHSHILNSDTTGYLAQHDLLSQIPALRQDISVPDYCYLDTPPPDVRIASSVRTITPTTDDDVHMNIWFGPPWTISPLHHDPYHNILCQIVGKKYVRLYSPEHTSRLYPRGEEPAPHGDGTINMSNTSNIDVAAMELSPHEEWNDIYPGISDVPYLECILEAGQALYIPVGWWHYVRSISVGVSVSFWWN